MYDRPNIQKRRLARAVAFASLPALGGAGVAAQAQGDGDNFARLEEVVVTASRRSETVTTSTPAASTDFCSTAGEGYCAVPRKRRERGVKP